MCQVALVPRIPYTNADHVDERASEDLAQRKVRMRFIDKNNPLTPFAKGE